MRSLTRGPQTKKGSSLSSNFVQQLKASIKNALGGSSIIGTMMVTTPNKLNIQSLIALIYTVYPLLWKPPS